MCSFLRSHPPLRPPPPPFHEPGETQLACQFFGYAPCPKNSSCCTPIHVQLLAAVLGAHFFIWLSEKKRSKGKPFLKSSPCLMFDCGFYNVKNIVGIHNVFDQNWSKTLCSMCCWLSLSYSLWSIRRMIKSHYWWNLAKISRSFVTKSFIPKTAILNFTQ